MSPACYVMYFSKVTGLSYLECFNLFLFIRFETSDVGQDSPGTDSGLHLLANLKVFVVVISIPILVPELSNHKTVSQNLK